MGKDIYKKMKKILLGQSLLHIIIGLGAIGGGTYLILDPSGKLIGLPIEYINTSVFKNYLIPGIILFTTIGIGNLIGAMLSFKKHQYSGEFAKKLGEVLFIWMTVQLIVVGYKMWIQILFVCVSIIQFILGLYCKQKIKMALLK